ncbi:hypothetical protein CL620_05990 [archaeon]|nr:hypothetical protein [archaeon]|tara:strand:- start:133 stop:651 length:519 start_codon:yes stop_codon:yes gene_type:complete
MKSKKGAIGLSVNTLVIIIIGMVMLVGGIALLYKFIGGSEDIKDSLDQRTASELERLLVDQGKQVALPLNRKTVTRGETVVFGIGTLNVNTEEKNFRIEVKHSGGDESIEEWLLYNQESFNLKQNEHHKETILVKPDANVEADTYIFNAKVIDLNEPGKTYGTVQKMYVIVK